MTELERRDTPAWWSVAAPSPAEGTVGSTDASHAGDLTLNPDSPAVNGVVTVWAGAATEALTKALVDSGGFIYDYDGLGLVRNEQVNGFIKRVRSNIRAFAAITVDGTAVRPSGICAYSIRFSMKQTGPNPGNDWSIINPPDVPGDNDVLVGPSTPLQLVCG